MADPITTGIRDAVRFQKEGGILGHTTVNPAAGTVNIGPAPNGFGVAFGKTVNAGTDALLYPLRGGVLGHTQVGPGGVSVGLPGAGATPNGFGRAVDTVTDFLIPAKGLGKHFGVFN
jgi:hypothetical protein